MLVEVGAQDGVAVDGGDHVGGVGSVAAGQRAASNGKHSRRGRDARYSACVRIASAAALAICLPDVSSIRRELQFRGSVGIIALNFPAWRGRWGRGGAAAGGRRRCLAGGDQRAVDHVEEGLDGDEAVDLLAVDEEGGRAARARSALGRALQHGRFTWVSSCFLHAGGQLGLIHLLLRALVERNLVELAGRPWRRLLLAADSAAWAWT